MKALLSTFALAFFFTCLSAQTTLPTNQANGKITYRFSLPVDENISNEEAYEMVTNWFGSHPKDFTRSNVSITPENISRS